jgi:hypothetical protein
MGSRIYPSVSSPIKSIQRGTAASAGNITISSVDINKAFATSFSNGAAGTVAGSANTSGTYTPSGGAVGAPGGNWNQSGSFPVAKYGAYLVNSTTITVTGACIWQVVEYL